MEIAIYQILRLIQKQNYYTNIKSKSDRHMNFFPLKMRYLFPHFLKQKTYIKIQKVPFVL